MGRRCSRFPELPHYFSLFAWCSTFGGFALLVVYLLMSVGALVGLRDHERYGGVVLAAIVGIAITAAAIFGSFYKVTSPTILAPVYALIWGALGFLYMTVVKGRPPASDVLDELRSDGAEADRAVIVEREVIIEE